MKAPNEMLYKNRRVKPESSSNLFFLHKKDDHRGGDYLLIWVFALTAQALLCIWMVIQASTPPDHAGTECTEDVTCDVATASQQPPAQSQK